MTVMCMNIVAFQGEIPCIELEEAGTRLRAVTSHKTAVLNKQICLGGSYIMLQMNVKIRSCRFVALWKFAFQARVEKRA